MIKYLYAFTAVSVFIEILKQLLCNLIFHKEEHSSEYDYVITEQVMAYIIRHKLSIESTKYAYNHETFPQGMILGNCYFANVKIMPDDLSSFTAKEITIWFPRCLKKPVWIIPKQINKKKLFGAANNKKNDDTDNDIDSDSDDSKQVKYEIIAKTSDELGSRYTLDHNMIHLDNEHDMKTWEFAVRFAKQCSKQEKCIILFGEPGVGKTTIAKALSITRKARLLKIDPTSAGINLQNALRMDDKHILILMDDIDKGLQTIYNNKVEQCQRNHVRRVYDKCSWNGLLDELKDKENVTVVMTMNSIPSYQGFDDFKNPKWLDICPSMLRIGRVHTIYEIFSNERWLTHEPISFKSTTG